MKKLIAFVLVAALIFCCVGCTQETPEVTDPSSTQPPDVTDPSGTDETDPPTDPTEAPTDPIQAGSVKYTSIQIIGWLDSYPYYLGVYHSVEELQESVFQNWELESTYNSDFFADKTLIILSTMSTPPSGKRVIDLTRNDDGSYLLKVEYLSTGVSAGMLFGTTLLIAVEELIPADAEIKFESIRTIVSPDDERWDELLR
jgi:hypothetical protein